MIFGITHLLGIRFAPRIKDLPDQRLWRLPDSALYQHIEAAVSDKLNVNLIRDTWDEMLRLAASLKYGDEKASLIVGKLAAASHRNRLFRGLQELGRLVKTAYLYVIGPSCCGLVCTLKPVTCRPMPADNSTRSN